MTSYFAKYNTPKGTSRSRRMTIRGGGGSAPEIMALKRSIINPFSSSAHTKIPDGKSTLSNAMKVQCVTTLRFKDRERLLFSDDTGNSVVTKFPGYYGKDVVDLLYFPGFNNMLLIATHNADHSMTWRTPSQNGPDAGNDEVQTNAAANGQPVRRRANYAIPSPMYQHDELKLVAPLVHVGDLPQPPEDGNTVNGNLLSPMIGFSERVGFANSQNKIDRWRLVSTGFKIACTNNSSNNAGWWEAQRIQIPKQGEEWALLPMPYRRNVSYAAPLANAADANSVAGLNEYYAKTSCYIGAKPTFDNTVVPLQPLATDPDVTSGSSGLPYVNLLAEMSNNPTYISGKIRDIHKTIFKLRPTTDEHDFKSLSDTLRRGNYGENYPYNQLLGQQVNESDAHQLVDDTFDAIHIRLHGEPETVFMMHYVANQELVYDEASIIARTATRCAIGGSDRQIAQAYNTATPATAATAGTHLNDVPMLFAQDPPTNLVTPPSRNQGTASRGLRRSASTPLLGAGPRRLARVDPGLLPVARNVAAPARVTPRTLSGVRSADRAAAANRAAARRAAASARRAAASFRAARLPTDVIPAPSLTSHPLFLTRRSAFVPYRPGRGEEPTRTGGGGIRLLPYKATRLPSHKLPIGTLINPSRMRDWDTPPRAKGSKQKRL